MQHESSNNELVAGRCRKFHASSVISKSATAAAVSDARLTAQCYVLFSLNKTTYVCMHTRSVVFLALTKWGSLWGHDKCRWEQIQSVRKVLLLFLPHCM